MFRLVAILYVLIATVLAGAAVTVLLSMNMVHAAQIAAAAAAGAVVAVPVAWLVGKQMWASMGRHA